MHPKLILILLLSTFTYAQGQDSSKTTLQKISPKNIEKLNGKIEKYYSVINSKTEKTLERLCVWEQKIKEFLEKVNPQVASQLFSTDQITFKILLQYYKEGKSTVDEYKSEYDRYFDDL